MSDPKIALNVHDTGGSGRAVVLIHGWPLSSKAWEPQIGVLSRVGYRVIAYDRRGFGASDKPASGYDYDTLTDDLNSILTENDLDDATLVGFSMGGGEVARHASLHGQERVKSVVFASAVPPFLMQGPDNPDGPLTKEKAAMFEHDLRADRAKFFGTFTTNFFSANGELCVPEAERQKAIAQCLESDETAALACMKSWATTHFRPDLKHVRVPTLVLHGDADAVVDFEGSGARTHAAIPGSRLHVIPNAPHGCNVSHADEFNRTLLDFLRT